MSAPLLVAVTRADGPDAPFARALEAHGFATLDVPTIAIEPPHDPSRLEAAIALLASHHALVFTSAHAVDAAVRCAAWPAAWASALPRPLVAAVGPATARRLAENGIQADLVPPAAGALELVDALRARIALRGCRVLWPRSSVARPELAEALEAAGAMLDAPIAYRTVNARPGTLGLLREALDASRLHAIAFLSPSSALGLALAFDRTDLRLLSGRTRVASLGPTTTAALRAMGVPPDIEAATRSGEALAAAIAQDLRHGRPADPGSRGSVSARSPEA